MKQKSPWLVQYSKGNGSLRLYCFCYAGGSAVVFSSWKDVLDPSIEICAVQLPGRGTRMLEAPLMSLETIIAEVAQTIAQQGQGPFVFFGHSLGGLIAFEVARYCMQNGLPTPVHLIVSGTEAPQFRESPKNIHLLEDDDLIAELRSYNGTPPEVLANKELMSLVLPILRADFALVNDYKYVAGQRLSMPLSVFIGTGDEHTRHMDKWSEETTAPSQSYWFDGDHFFINTHKEYVLRLLNTILRQYS